MSTTSKVIWNEGLFLSPQLFQQQERYLESMIHARCNTLSSFFWGMHSVLIDQDGLAVSTLSLRKASGTFADGTTFDAPSVAALPAPLTITSEHIGKTIYLAIPIRQLSHVEVFLDQACQHRHRYTISEQELPDLHTPSQPARPVQLAKLQLYLVPANEMNGSWTGIPITHISSIHANHQVVLDETFMPPTIFLDTSKTLSDLVKSVLDLMHARADSMANHVTHAGNKASSPAEITDYLLLSLLNRHGVILTHLLSKMTQPETVYLQLCSLAAELATFTRSTARYVDYPAYQHIDPAKTFLPLIRDLHIMLNEVMIRNAQRIDLQVRPHHVRQAHIPAATLQTYNMLVMAVSASVPAESLSHYFVARCKIGPADKLPELIRSHVSGIPLIPLPAPPRHIPFHSGCVYFALDTKGAMWDHVYRHGDLAMHIAGDIPDLQIGLWATKDER